MDFADPETAPTILPFTKFEIMGEFEMLWAHVLAYVTGTVNQELLLRNEYLAAENRILRGQIQGRLLLSKGEKATLAEIAHRLGRKVLDDVAAAAKPDTILGWYRKLIANKFDGSKFRRSVGRPKVDQETERLVAKMARENPSWGYDRIVGALANLGIVYPIKRWATSSVATAFLQRRSESKRSPGRTLSAPTGTFWWGWISSQQKS
jgi:hypothetical protein